jgi:hypothetical protein
MPHQRLTGHGLSTFIVLDLHTSFDSRNSHHLPLPAPLRYLCRQATRLPQISASLGKYRAALPPPIYHSYLERTPTLALENKVVILLIFLSDSFFEEWLFE